MKALAINNKKYWSNRSFVRSVIIALVLLLLVGVVNYWAVHLAASDAGNYTTDILLDNLPVINTDFIVSEGVAFLVAFIVLLCVWEPKVIPFVVKSITVFYFVRSAFVIMTHLAPLPNRIHSDFSHFKYVTTGSDLFFSGHTGLPFLLSLIFWDNKALRYIFIGISVIEAIGVILGHLHYTIDVFSAYFIAFGVYHFVLKFFKDDYRLFIHGLETNHL